MTLIDAQNSRYTPVYRIFSLRSTEYRNSVVRNKCSNKNYWCIIIENKLDIIVRKHSSGNMHHHVQSLINVFQEIMTHLLLITWRPAVANEARNYRLTIASSVCVQVTACLQTRMCMWCHIAACYHYRGWLQWMADHFRSALIRNYTSRSIDMKLRSADYGLAVWCG